MRGTVVALGTAPAAGAPIQSRASLRLVPTVGPEGDRYARDEGTFRAFPDQEVTLIEAEDAEALGIDPLAARRNVVTRGVRLEDLIGRSFRVGGVTLHGMRPCLPCGHLARLLDRPDLKAKLRGGLRARIVHGGEVRVGDAVEPAPVEIDDDMRAVVESAHLAFVATVTADGKPNLSPKGTIRVLDGRRLFFLEIASPQTRKNLASSPWMEINVVDATSRRGWRFLGRASVHADDATHRAATARVEAEDGSAYGARAAVVLEVERALPLVSPGYTPGLDEWGMRGAWKEKRARLDEGFEAHVRRRGPYSRG